MTMPQRVPISPRAFTLVELLVVVVVLGVLAAVATVATAGASAHRRTVTLGQSLEEVRSALARFRADATLEATDPFPSLADLTAATLIPSGSLPDNPVTGSNDAAPAADASAAEARQTNGPAAWIYFPSPATNTAWFYANTSDPTTRSDPLTGDPLTANQL